MALTQSDRAGFERRRAEAPPRASCWGWASRNPDRGRGGPYTGSIPTPRKCASTGRLRLALRGLDLDGPGQRDGLHPDRDDRLGLPPDRIQVFSGDSDALDAGRATADRRHLGRRLAVLRATEKAIERGRRIAAHLLEAAPEDVALRDGRFVVAAPTAPWRGAAWPAPRISRASSARARARLERHGCVHAAAVTFPMAATCARSRWTERPAWCAWSATPSWTTSAA